MRKLERYAAGTDEMKPDSFTIEHIMPESTENEEAGKIGNLIPLGEKLNSQLGDKDFINKISRYPESHYQSVKVFVHEYEHLTSWCKKQIDERTEHLAMRCEQTEYDNKRSSRQHCNVSDVLPAWASR